LIAIWFEFEFEIVFRQRNFFFFLQKADCSHSFPAYIDDTKIQLNIQFFFFCVCLIFFEDLIICLFVHLLLIQFRIFWLREKQWHKVGWRMVVRKHNLQMLHVKERRCFKEEM
jgi:hypothetical protein